MTLVQPVPPKRTSFEEKIKCAREVQYNKEYDKMNIEGIDMTMCQRDEIPNDSDMPGDDDISQVCCQSGNQDLNSTDSWNPCFDESIDQGTPPLKTITKTFIEEFIKYSRARELAESLEGATEMNVDSEEDSPENDAGDAWKRFCKPLYESALHIQHSDLAETESSAIESTSGDERDGTEGNNKNQSGDIECLVRDEDLCKVSEKGVSENINGTEFHEKLDLVATKVCNDGAEYDEEVPVKLEPLKNANTVFRDTSKNRSEIEDSALDDLVSDFLIETDLTSKIEKEIDMSKDSASSASDGDETEIIIETKYTEKEESEKESLTNRKKSESVNKELQSIIDDSSVWYNSLLIFGDGKQLRKRSKVDYTGTKIVKTCNKSAIIAKENNLCCNVVDEFLKTSCNLASHKDSTVECTHEAKRPKKESKESSGKNKASSRELNSITIEDSVIWFKYTLPVGTGRCMRKHEKVNYTGTKIVKSLNEKKNSANETSSKPKGLIVATETTQETNNSDEKDQSDTNEKSKVSGELLQHLSTLNNNKKTANCIETKKKGLNGNTSNCRKMPKSDVSGKNLNACQKETSDQTQIEVLCSDIADDTQNSSMETITDQHNGLSSTGMKNQESVDNSSGRPVTLDRFFQTVKSVSRVLDPRKGVMKESLDGLDQNSGLITVDKSTKTLKQENISDSSNGEKDGLFQDNNKTKERSKNTTLEKVKILKKGHKKPFKDSKHTAETTNKKSENAQQDIERDKPQVQYFRYCQPLFSIFKMDLTYSVILI